MFGELASSQTIGRQRQRLIRCAVHAPEQVPLSIRTRQTPPPEFPDRRPDAIP
jgi:hypothetical protein